MRLLSGYNEHKKRTQSTHSSKHREINGFLCHQERAGVVARKNKRTAQRQQIPNSIHPTHSTKQWPHRLTWTQSSTKTQTILENAGQPGHEKRFWKKNSKIATKTPKLNLPLCLLAFLFSESGGRPYLLVPSNSPPLQNNKTAKQRQKAKKLKKKRVKKIE